MFFGLPQSGGLPETDSEANAAIPDRSARPPAQANPRPAVMSLPRRPAVELRLPASARRVYPPYRLPQLGIARALRTVILARRIRRSKAAAKSDLSGHARSPAPGSTRPGPGSVA